MRSKLVFLILCIMLVACNRRANYKSDTLPVETLTESVHKNTKSVSAAPVAKSIDTAIVVPKGQGIIIDMEPLLEEIEKATYDKCKRDYRTHCALDSSGFIRGMGLSVKSDCDEVCETFLIENKTGQKMDLPANFDAGLIGLLVSPSCKRFITYSSYDMPDYDKYYSNRALLTCYDITDDVGLKAIRLKQTYGLKQWSIAEVIWKDEQSVVLKMYDGNFAELVEYKYFKVVI